MTTRRLAAFSFVFLLFAAPTAAQVTFGIRAGASVNDPDQFYFGGHVETPPLADNIFFRPNVEIGVGDDVTTLTFNVELAYKFPTSGPWRPYVLAGPALVVYDVDEHTDTQAGFNIGFGLEHSGGLFGEIKVGTIDSPDFKVGFGFRF
jgi:hypothetical protein